MELWIRSQDQETLVKVDGLKTYSTEISGKDVFEIEDNKYHTLGAYKSKERLLEVLDEIATIIKNRYIVKANALLKPDDLAKEQKRLDYLYSGEFIIEKPPFEIEPINSNVIYYEMPKE